MIDTDIVIYSLKNNTTVVENFRKFINIPKSLSVITYGELVFGARKSQNVEKNLATVRRIKELFPIVDISPAIVETFGELKAALQTRGSPLDDMDLLIASTAMTHGLILVTNNERHFSRVAGLELVNWSK